MADTKISGFSAAAAYDGTEVFPVVQGGANKKGLISALYTHGLHNSELFGSGAGVANVAGNYASFFGKNAGNGSNSDYNTGFGAFALTSASGDQNVAVGVNAGAACADKNVAVGHDALQLCAASTQCTAVGYFAGQNSAGCLGATLIGSNAGVNATGQYNTHLGAFTGSTTTGGARQTCLGAGAVGATAASNDLIALGFGAIAATNQCSIGRDIAHVTTFAACSNATYHETFDLALGYTNNTEASRQTRNIFSCYNISSAQEYMRADSATDQVRLGFGGAIVAGQRTTFYNAINTDIALAVRASASPSVDLTQWQTNAGTAKARITKNCEFSNPLSGGGLRNEFFGAGNALTQTTGNDDNTICGNACAPLLGSNISVGASNANVFVGSAIAPTGITMNFNVLIGSGQFSTLATAAHSVIGCVVIGSSSGANVNRAVNGVVAIGNSTDLWGDSDVVIGDFTFGGTGGSNLILGATSGNGGLTCTNCVVLGSNAAINNLAAQTNAILIGANTDVADGSFDNCVAIGGSAMAQGSKTIMLFTGQAAVGDATRLDFGGRTTGGMSVLAVSVDSVWTNSTHATRNSRAVISTYNVATAQEGLRIESASDQARAAIGGAIVSGQRLTVLAGVDAEKVLVANGTASQTGNLFEAQKNAAIQFGIGSGGKILTNQFASASVGVGVLADKIPIYDTTGTLLGYLPVYATIT